MDAARFQREYEGIADQLYTFLVRSVGDRDLAGDILQETALKAFRGRHGFRGGSSFKTWIYRIAINTMKNQWTKGQRHRNMIADVHGEDQGSIRGPEAAFTARESIRQLSRALELLQENYRIPFLLRHVDGLSYQEISRVLEVEENAARVRVYRARLALRSLLEAEKS